MPQSKTRPATGPVASTPVRCKLRLVLLTVRLPKDEIRRLKALAAKTGTSVTALINQALQQYVGGARRMSGEAAPK